jgi:hypothetical protein
MLKRKGASEEEKARAENTGVLVSSGFIAGESLMAVVLALLVIGADKFPLLLSFQSLNFLEEPSFLLSLFAYVIVLGMLVWLPVSQMKSEGLPSTHLDH